MKSELTSSSNVYLFTELFAVVCLQYWWVQWLTLPWGNEYSPNFAIGRRKHLLKQTALKHRCYFDVFTILSLNAVSQNYEDNLLLRFIKVDHISSFKPKKYLDSIYFLPYSVVITLPIFSVLNPINTFISGVFEPKLKKRQYTFRIHDFFMP